MGLKRILTLFFWTAYLRKKNVTFLSILSKPELLPWDRLERGLRPRQGALGLCSCLKSWRKTKPKPHLAGLRSSQAPHLPAQRPVLPDPVAPAPCRQLCGG